MRISSEKHKENSRLNVKKAKAKQLKNHYEMIEIYNKNPARCIYCNHPLKYIDRKNKFCSRSCAAKVNNQKRIIRPNGKTKIEQCQKCNNNFSISNHSSEKICLECKINKQKYFIDIDGKRVQFFHPVTFSNCEDCNNIFLKRTYNNLKCKSCSINYKFIYRGRASFNFKELLYTPVYNLELVKKYGWYSIVNKNGVTYDHLYRVIDGFKNNVDPTLLKHPANAEMVPWFENRKRQHKSMLTLNQLLERIEKWNKGEYDLEYFYID
jgi:hypothetical protein